METALERCRRRGNSEGDVGCANWTKKRERTHIIIEQVKPHRRVERPQKVTHGSPLPAATQLLQLLWVYCVVACVLGRLGQRLCSRRRHPLSGGLEALEANLLFALSTAISGRPLCPNAFYPQNFCNNVHVVAITNICRITLGRPLPPPLLSALELWPTWFWALAGRDLGTWGTRNKSTDAFRTSEPQLTSRLPLPIAAPFSYRE